MNTPFHDVIIIGAGPAGLSLATRLGERGVDALVLESGSSPGNSWQFRHPQLRLNTHRRNSALPGLPVPRSAGAFPGAAAYASYLRCYAANHGLKIARETTASRVEPNGHGWRVETQNGAYLGRALVVATGYDRVPVIPGWPGRGEFEGRIVHAAEFGRARDYRDKHVLVVGAGNSGGDILNTLVLCGARSLAVSVRNGPTVVPKRVLGFPMQLLAPSLERMPLWLADAMLAMSERLSCGNLRRLKLRDGRARAARRLAYERVAPAIDDGFVSALRRGHIRVHGEITGFQGSSILFSDGSSASADVVIAATGYRPGLEGLVGHLGVLDPRGYPKAMGAEAALPGLWFALTPPPLGGTLRRIGANAMPLAASICAALDKAGVVTDALEPARPPAEASAA